MVRKSQMASPAPRAVFVVHQNNHTDGSFQFDVYQRGDHCRIASASTEAQANALCASLNAALHIWELANTGNTVDA